MPAILKRKMTNSAMLPSVNSMPPIVLLANPGDKRVELFQAALAALELPPARLVAYADLLAGRAHLAEFVSQGAIVRIESPGRNFEVEQALLALGAEQHDDEDPDASRYERFSVGQVERLSFEKGRLLPLRQWYLGWRAALAMIEAQLAECPAHRLMQHPAEILVMFDKRASHARLQAAGLRVAPALPIVESYDGLIAAMRESGYARVFVKASHGSSAAGVVAFQTNGRQQIAITTMEYAIVDGETRWYNSRRIRRYERPNEIAALIDALCRQRVHCERWLPKASHDGRSFDLRVLVIGGQAQHVVVRSSKSPMTNLHLLNKRGDWPAIRGLMGEERWQQAKASCEAVMKSFPNSLYAGIDLLIGQGLRSHAILEVNAFGDLLPNLLYQGRDSYSSEIMASLGAEHIDKVSLC
jgi:hypothetical protein